MSSRGPSVEHELNTLTNLIYEAVLDQSAFQEFVGAFAKATDSHFAGIEIVETGNDNFCQWQADATFGLSRSALLELNKTHAQQNPFVDLVAEEAVEGSIYFDSDVMSKKQLRSMRYYDEFMRHYDFEHLTGLYVIHNSNMSVIASTAKGCKALPYTERDRTLFRLILPHIQKFVRINSRLGETGIERDLSWSALDRLRQPVLAVGQEGGVLFANDAAREVVMQEDGLSLIAGNFCVTSQTVNARLKLLLAQAGNAYEDPGSFQSEYELIVPRKSGARPFLLNIMPLQHSSHFLGARAATALVFITDLEDHTNINGQALVTLYGLTQSEARVATLLARGLALEEIARRLEHSVHTTRTILKRVYSKTDTHRQSELVYLVLRTAGTPRH